MALRFTVLASGSGGNASLLEADGYSVLIDGGLGPRQIGTRLSLIGASWPQIQAVLLTHTHTDHWKETTLAYLRRLRIPLYCHAGHHPWLGGYSSSFLAMQNEQLVHGYRQDEPLALGPSVRCRPLELRHDGGPTFGFRFESTPGTTEPWALAYLADLGSWGMDLARAVADVDVLALEFNHDVAMEYNSGRSPRLIARVLGDAGHLSNVQAAALLQEILRLSQPGRLRHVIQLHLSRDCNRPELAAQVARACLQNASARIEIHTSNQHRPGPCLTLDRSRCFSVPIQSRARASRARVNLTGQPWLPGWEDEDVSLAE